jgi:endonuclease-8
MPEGDTLFRAATGLRKALLGKPLTAFETTVDPVRAMARKHAMLGRVVTAVEAQGKHLLITLRPPPSQGPHPSDRSDTSDESPDLDLSNPSDDEGLEGSAPPDGIEVAHPGDPATAGAVPPPVSSTVLVLHTHLRMTGSWHIYRPGERWRKPARFAVVVLRTADLVTPCFSAPIVELLTGWQAKHHPELRKLGPDAMLPEFDAEAVLARFRRYPQVEIGVALLNQRLMAGVGNIYKSEVLFSRRVYPFAKVGELSDKTLRGLIEESHRLLRLNETRGERRTVFGIRQNERLWAYSRAGSPCRVCGGPIRVSKQGIDARLTYWCPNCQAPEGGS